MKARYPERKTGPDDFRSFVVSVFRKMKDPATFKCVPVFDDEGNRAGYLRPITGDYRAALPGSAALLAKWRNENPTLSAVPFTATAEGTARWLDAQVIGRDDRLLFLILSDREEKIGHIGFSSFDFAERSCEVDAVLRGDRNAAPGMMTFALRALIGWGIRELGPSAIRLRVFEDNLHAIEFYKRNGFYEQGKSPCESGKDYLVMRYRADGADSGSHTPELRKEGTENE